MPLHSLGTQQVRVEGPTSQTQAPHIESPTKFADSSQVQKEQQSKLKDVKNEAKVWVQNHAGLVAGIGKNIQYVGLAGSLLLAPLAIPGALLGAVAAKIAKETKLMPGREDRLVTAGLIVGTLGLYGAFVVGRDIKMYANDHKEKDHPLDSKHKELPKVETALTEKPAPTVIKPKLNDITEQSKMAEEDLRNLQLDKRQNQSAVKSYQGVVEASQATIEMSKESIRSIQDRNKNNKDFAKLLDQYANVPTHKQEQFVSDLRKTNPSLYQPMQEIHEHFNDIEKQSSHLRNEQATLEYYQKEVSKNEEAISTIQGKIDALNVEAKTIKSSLLDLEHNSKMEAVLADYQQSPVSDQIRALESEIARQIRYLNNAPITESDQRNQYIEKLEAKRAELQSGVETVHVKTPELEAVIEPEFETPPVVETPSLMADAKPIEAPTVKPFQPTDEIIKEEPPVDFDAIIGDLDALFKKYS